MPCHLCYSSAKTLSKTKTKQSCVSLSLIIEMLLSSFDVYHICLEPCHLCHSSAKTLSKTKTKQSCVSLSLIIEMLLSSFDVYHICLEPLLAFFSSPEPKAPGELIV